MGNAKKVRRKRLLRKLRKISLITVGVFFVGYAFYLGATWGPGPVDSASRHGTGGDNRELVERSKALVQQFDSIAAYRKPTSEELNLLRRAIALQREYNSTRPASPEDRRQQQDLENRLAEILAEEIHQRSLAAEREGAQLAEQGKIEAAVEAMRKAWELQRQVNQQYGRSGFRDTVRETRLEQQIASMRSAPLHQRSVELEKAADLAIEEFRWREARQFLTEASQLQTRVNDISRRSTFYSPRRVTELARKIDSLTVGEMMTEVENLHREATKLEEEGQWERAAAKYERAMIVQNQINRDHPQSRFVSREKVTAFDAARQTALSTPQARQLNALATRTLR